MLMAFWHFDVHVKSPTSTSGTSPAPGAAIHDRIAHVDGVLAFPRQKNMSDFQEFHPPQVLQSTIALHMLMAFWQPHFFNSDFQIWNFTKDAGLLKTILVLAPYLFGVVRSKGVILFQLLFFLQWGRVEK